MKIRLLTILLPLTALATIQGPDAGGYSATDSAVFSFVDISGGGGGTSILSGTDDGTVNVTIPFSFQFYGTGYTNVCVSTNGAAYLLSDPSLCAGINDFANTDLSGGAPPNDQPALLPLWSDLTFQTPGAGSVFYQTLGVAPNRRFIIQWNNAYPQGSANGMTFQVILTETTSAIAFQYQTVTIGGGDPANNGALATIGIRNAGAQTSGRQLQWAFNAGVLADGVALTFTKGAGPLPPTLVAPSNGNLSGPPVTLTWSASPGATSYDVYFGTTNPPALLTNVTGTSYSVTSANYSTSYNWQIVAKNGAGSGASAIWSFTTGPAPPPPPSGVIPISPMSAAPTSITFNSVVGAPLATQTVTISFLTSTQGTPTFAGNSNTNQGQGWLSLSPASGPMTESFANSLYTYKATITIKADPTGIAAGSKYTGAVNLVAAGSIVSVPVTLNVSAPVPPQPTGGIANAASGGQALASVIAPGSYIAIYGTALAGTGTPSATTLPLPTTLNGAQVTVCGIPVPLLYASPTQINALLPQNLNNSTSCPLVVITGTISSTPIQLVVTQLQPGIYTVDTSGSGAGIVTNALTGIQNDASHPARTSDYLVIYATGLGQVRGPNGELPPADGVAAPLSTLFRTTSTVTATIGGVSAPVSFSGLTPTFAGLYQVNVQVPAGVTAGDAVKVVLTETDPQTKATGQSNTVTISVR